jgi:hypothetical protein
MLLLFLDTKTMPVILILLGKRYVKVRMQETFYLSSVSKVNNGIPVRICIQLSPKRERWTELQCTGLDSVSDIMVEMLAFLLRIREFPFRFSVLRPASVTSFLVAISHARQTSRAVGLP